MSSKTNKFQEVNEVELEPLETHDDELDTIPTSTEGRMNLTKWLACIGLGLSYSTAIQQHACTATIVKHIDAALGEYSKCIRLAN
jgi:hypothetical protein